MPCDLVEGTGGGGGIKVGTKSDELEAPLGEHTVAVSCFGGDYFFSGLGCFLKFTYDDHVCLLIGVGLKL